jgi:hypothetical protein
MLNYPLAGVNPTFHYPILIGGLSVKIYTRAIIIRTT